MSDERLADALEQLTDELKAQREQRDRQPGPVIVEKEHGVFWPLFLLLITLVIVLDMWDQARKKKNTGNVGWGSEDATPEPTPAPRARRPRPGGTTS